MNTKAATFVLIVGLAVIVAVALRTNNRAQAEAGDCYSETQGPSTPTICK